MEFTTWPQVNMINQKNYYTYVASLCISLSFTGTRWDIKALCETRWWAGRFLMPYAKARRTFMP